MRMIILLVLLFVPAGVNAEVTTVTQNNLVVTWHPVQEGITHFAYNISVQNLQDTGKDIDISTLISDTSFDLSQLKNVKFYERKNVSSAISVPIYENQSHDYTYVDNATGKELTETRWRMAQTGTATETAHAMQWKPAKMQSFEKTATAYKERMGTMNVPKYASKEEDGTGNGTKWFRLEFDAPIQKLANGWGSAGKVALEIDGLEYHPWWGNGSAWQYRRLINITNNNYTQVLEAGYTVNLTFDHASNVTANKSLVNGFDVRVVWEPNASYSLELDRINTTAFNSSSTVIWFKLQENISAGDSDANYSLYYGNPSAGAPPEDGSNIYLLYDDFSMDTGVWSTVNDTNSKVEIDTDVDHRVELTNWKRTEVAYAYASIGESISDFEYTYTFKFTYRDSGQPFIHVGLADSVGAVLDVSNGLYATVQYKNDNTHDFSIEHATSGTGNWGTTINYATPGTMYITFTRLGTSVEHHIYTDADRTIEISGSPTTFTDSSPVTFSNIYVATTRHGPYGEWGDGWVDDVKLRKYLSHEPTASLGGEETPITLENSTYTPGYGNVGDTFNFTVDVSNPEGGSVNATLFVNDASVDSDTVSANDTASVLWTATVGGDYTYHWEAASSNSTGRYPESGEAAGPVVYDPSYEKSIDVPGGASRLMCTAIWTGLYNISGVTVALTDPGSTLYQEFDNSTATRKKIIETIIPLPGLANYNITRYDGLTKMSISSPAQGTWTFRVTDTNVTSFETDVDIS